MPETEILGPSRHPLANRKFGGLFSVALKAHTAIIVVTHDEKIIPTFKRVYHIRDGQTIEEKGEGRSLE